MNPIYLTLCIPLSRWAFTNIKGSIHSFFVAWKLASNIEDRIQPLTQNSKDINGVDSAKESLRSNIPEKGLLCSLLCCFFIILLSRKTQEYQMMTGRITNTSGLAFCVFICGQASEKWPENRPVYLVSPSHYQHISQRRKGTEKPWRGHACTRTQTHAHAHTQTSRSTYLSPRPPILGYWSAKWLFHFGLIFQPHPPSKTWKLGSRQQSTISPRCRKLRVSGKKSCSSASPPLHALSPNWVTSRHEVFDNTFFSPSFRDHTEPSLDSHPTNRWLYLLLSWEDGGHQPWSKFNSPLFYL